MHVHNVYFWLKTDEPSEDFESGLRGLTQDPNVRASYFGTPAGTDRDVVENSYTYGLVLVFDDTAGHDSYQAGRAHLEFLDAHLESWGRVTVHDIAT
ncbi:MAG: Dabb family protein [Acidimicrobiia bacterium]